MKFEQINVQDLARKEYFEHYLKLNVTHEMTKKVDVSHAVEYCRSNGLSFYAFCIYTLTRVVNRIENYQYDFHDNQLIKWDEIIPLFTIFDKKSALFRAVYLDMTDDIIEFNQRYRDVVNQYTEVNRLFPMETYPANCFSISAIAWTDYDAFSLGIRSNEPHLKPIITFGKYTECGDALFMPVTMRSHHATVDGFHVAQFFELLQEEMKSKKA